MIRDDQHQTLRAWEYVEQEYQADQRDQDIDDRAQQLEHQNEGFCQRLRQEEYHVVDADHAGVRAAPIFEGGVELGEHPVNQRDQDEHSDNAK